MPIFSVGQLVLVKAGDSFSALMPRAGAPSAFNPPPYVLGMICHRGPHSLSISLLRDSNLHRCEGNVPLGHGYWAEPDDILPLNEPASFAADALIHDAIQIIIRRHWDWLENGPVCMAYEDRGIAIDELLRFASPSHVRRGRTVTLERANGQFYAETILRLRPAHLPPGASSGNFDLDGMYTDYNELRKYNLLPETANGGRRSSFKHFIRKVEHVPPQ